MNTLAILALVFWPASLLASMADEEAMSGLFAAVAFGVTCALAIWVLLT